MLLTPLAPSGWKGAAHEMYGAMGDLLGVFATRSKAAAIAQIALNKGLTIANVIQNTAAAATRALFELGPIAGPAAAAKIKAYGAAQVGLIAATGLAQAGAAGGGSAGLGSLAAQGSTGGTAVQPVEYRVYGIDRDAMYSGEFFEKVWNGLAEEGKRRGQPGPRIVFM